jgi:oligoribonuclease NrnB/cAMP/cGMP phosphodiesterase (DHH superfamily)
MKCYYHSKDLDGFASGAIMRRKFPTAELIGYDYGQPFEMNVGEKIIMADVSLPMPTMRRVAHASNGFTWIDHHISAINEYMEMVGDNLGFLDAILDPTISACEGTWKALFPDEEMPKAVELLGKYDTWRGNGTPEWENEILPFQYGMRLICNSLDTFPPGLVIPDPDDADYYDRHERAVESIIEKGKTVLAYQRSQNEIFCKSAFEAYFEGLRAICLNLPGASSTTFDSVYDPEKHDIIVSFSIKKDGTTFSLRTTKEDVDCSEIAKRFGGGGHRKAAGFKVPELSPEKYLKQ